MPDARPDSLCRLTVHADGRTVDLAVPSGMVLGQLLPSIVDLVHPDHDTIAGDSSWRLLRAGADALDESLTLQDNRIHDGDLLWLTTADLPPPRWIERDACDVVASTATASGQSSPRLPVTGSLAAAALGAAALFWSARTTTTAEHVMIGAGLTAAAITGSLTARWSLNAPLLCVTCSAIAVMFAAVTGAVAVPAGPVAAHVLLASAAAVSVSTLLLRFTRCGTTPLTALSTCALLVMTVSVAGVTWHLDTGAAGASLTALSFVLLSAAPRMSMMIARIAPGPPDVDEPDPLTIEDRAGLAHATLTGIVSGSSVAVAVGALVVACGQMSTARAPIAAVAFTAVAGVALMLRVRTHADPARRAVLISSGSVCAAAAFTITAMTSPHAAHWLSLLAAAGGAAALVPVLGMPTGPTARRTAEIAEYLALAALAPLACWIGGVYGLVRDLALT